MLANFDSIKLAAKAQADAMRASAEAAYNAAAALNPGFYVQSCIEDTYRKALADALATYISTVEEAIRA